MRRKIISVLVALSVIMSYSIVAYAEETTGEPSTPTDVTAYDAHFFVRVDKVVQEENGNTHYEASNYFPIGETEGYKYGDNKSDYHSVDGKVKSDKYFSNVAGNIIGEDGKVNEDAKKAIEECVYIGFVNKPTKEEVQAAAKKYGFEGDVDAIWYVIKREGDKIHVDGILYNVETKEVIVDKKDTSGDDENTSGGGGDTGGGGGGTIENPPHPYIPIPTPTPTVEPEGEVITPNGEAEVLDSFTVHIVYVDKRGNTTKTIDKVFTNGDRGDFSIPVDWKVWFIPGEGNIIPDSSEAYREGKYLGCSWWESEEKDREMTVYLCEKDDVNANVMGTDNEETVKPEVSGAKTGSDDILQALVGWLTLVCCVGAALVIAVEAYRGIGKEKDF